MELIVLVGLQGAGKTTFCERFFGHTHVYISKDRMPNVKNRSARQEKLIKEAFEKGQSVIIDNTNMDLESRQPLLSLATSYGAKKIVYYFPPDLPLSLQRNQQREEKTRIPEVAIYAMLKKLVPPSKQEGFDLCFEVRSLPNFEFQLTTLNK